MENNDFLDQEEYDSMMKSSYVRDYMNPACQCHRNFSLRLKERLEDKHQFVVKDGIGYWIIEKLYSNNELNVVPMDVAQFARFLGMEINLSEHRKKRDQDIQDMMDRARSSQRVLSEEERYELTAAFGKGATVISLLSGQKIHL